ncbi:transporter substrate-binding domain-containing protein [Marinobacter pelagius]|uniref:transporter substrate-binding domain-containing protein n=1 Tax=Marinobacter sp. C7 TaxID=2951363 RepID=UPI001EF0680A|nr:transporter substrate-binding domain-containing protein [Marinobacter sp. C7]MCG7198597.1 transporter substrate-binding domain-containing protein [Marinobacter sp. C7]
MIARQLLWLMPILASSVTVADPRTLELYTYEAPPYQSRIQLLDQKVSVAGETVETVTCAAREAGWSPQIRLAPQNRALYELRRDMIDGYFALDASTELDSAGMRSDPVALEEWYFFSTEAQTEPSKARIGVVNGSNELAWMEASGYADFLTVATPEQLLALLQRNRIDAALMDRRLMSELAGPMGENLETMHMQFVRYAPLYLYLNRQFDSRHPEFMAAFNRALSGCMEDHITLSSTERRQAEHLATPLLQELAQQVDLRQALADGPSIEGTEDIRNIDRNWQAQAPERAIPLAQRILELPASQALREWKSVHPGLVTEILVINRSGTIAAMSRLSSDFWQGDEAKFNRAMSGPESVRELYVSPIRFDASTSRFQIMVSSAIIPAGGGEPLGVVVLGLDVEKALKAHPLTSAPTAAPPRKPGPAPRIQKNH